MADDKNGPARGFGALGEWVSDVDKDLEGLEKPAPQVMTTARPVGGSVSGAKPASPASAGRSPARNGTDLLKRIGIGIGLWTGTILLFAFILKATVRPGQPATPARPVVAAQTTPVLQPTQAPPARWSAPPPSEAWKSEQRGVPVATEAEAEEEAVADDEEEVIPPIGRNNTLGPAEVRYCVCEKIRLEGMDREVDTRSEAEVDAYNEAVDDYNARCGSFRYRRGLLERIQEEAELRRNALESEGASRLDLVR